MKKIKSLFDACGDLRISIALFLLFALFCALATFIESAYGTPTAWAMVYGTLYFGFLQLLLGLNLLCALFKYHMLSLKKLPIALFHISFLLILIGAALTRYFGFEGLLHIRENETNAVITSTKAFVKFSAFENGQTQGVAAMKDIGLLPFANDLRLDLNLNEKASLRYKSLILDAKKVFTEDAQSAPLLALMLSNKEGQSAELVLKKGEVQNVEGVNFAFLADEVAAPYVKIDENLSLSSSENLNFMQMSDGSSGVLKAASSTDASQKRLYEIAGLNFVVKFASLHAKEEIKGANRASENSFWQWMKSAFMEVARTLLVSSFGEPSRWQNAFLLQFKDFAMSKDYQALALPQNAQNALELELSYKGESKTLYVFEEAPFVRADLGGASFFVQWSSSTLTLPFEIYLKDFILERYAGSMSPKSYESVVEVRDKDEKFDFRIYMNHVLDYRGYRFYQSSYDEDEKGTILSVNKDPGKLTTYAGYFLLFAGMFLSLLNPNSRFRKLAKLISQDSLKSLNAKALSLVLLAFFLASPLKMLADENLTRDLTPNSLQNVQTAARSAQNVEQNATSNLQNTQTTQQNATQQALENNQSLNSLNSLNSAQLPIVSPSHSQKLAFLAVQKNGRIVPFDTLAKEILEKIYKKSEYKGQDASAAVLSMMMDYKAWSKEPFIIMPKQRAVNEEISRLLGVAPAPYVSMFDFFDDKGYKLMKYVENANRKSPNARSVFDKELIKLDERANIVNLVFSTQLFNIFPKQDESDTTWLNPYELYSDDLSQQNPLAFLAFNNYITTLDDAFKSGDYTKADEALQIIKNYQLKFGASLMPSEAKFSAEIFSNHAQIFVKLTPLYLLAGALLLILILLKMIKPALNIRIAFKIVYFCNIFAFILHSAGLVLRTYLAGHAPWSNAYESMVYIAWALGLSGIFFSRKSPIALALTSILAGIVLWVAHLGELDPQITNLVPVLDSYWLSIHVSVITASYGFLGLCCLLGIFVLALMCFLKTGGKHNENILRNITEATRINEMAMILGLVLLTIGNFLGAIWANESWGRYWSWDAKETWALISILIYAAVLHTRLVPRFNSQYKFALFAMFAYWSIIMTYFGVNYFLVGLHSYAAGEAAQIPNSVYFGFAFMLILAIMSARKRKFVKKL